ncbi:outer membrane protein assembly factor BamE [Undibacterium luofuense]|uniref:Outer membrane protein assembly factor BamE n=1 Tax=Undibacterium luofuense TaxID=2828733 RepID=A0A941I835_9BURK|nr:outer membrane protein assembly factor BamE [Undibacterium luofuense]MBR7782468.1 outer membrane protein assembly factor BamE [Undibacterium luofuense]
MRKLFTGSVPASLGRIAVVLAAVSLGACASRSVQLTDENLKTEAVAGKDGTQVYSPTGTRKFLGFFSPYRISVQQGNFVSQEMMAQIKEGMNREQVRNVLGTALLTDPFHEDRWDYPFRLMKPSGELIISKVSVHFKNNLVSKFEGGNLPNEQEYLARVTESALAKQRIESVNDIDGKPARKEGK